MSRTLEAKLLLKGDDKTGKATKSAARGLENIAKQAKRTEDAYKRAAAAQKAMATNVRTNAREVERLHRAVQVQAERREQQIRRINGAVRNLRSSTIAADGAVLGFSTRFIAAAGTIAAATKAFNDYAAAQDRLDRIGITGDADEKTMGAVGKQVRGIAQDVALPVGEVTSGLETLVSAGKSVEDSIAMLPAVARAAQASNAAIQDIASSAVAVGDAFKIAAGEMEHAFDVMAHGGKLGKFELKDMAQYLPSLAPLAATQGYTGDEGLKRVVAMLQVVRAQTGSAEQAYNGVRDLISKMETDESAKNFIDFGVNIRKHLAKARKEGRDVVEAFLDAINMAIGEDYTKLPQLLGEIDSRNAALALISNRDKLHEYLTELGNAQGTVDRDLARLTDNLEQEFTRVKNAVDQVSTSVGEMMSSFGLPEGLQQTTEMLTKISGQIDDIAAREGGFLEKLTGRKGGSLAPGGELYEIGHKGQEYNLLDWLNDRWGGALDSIVDPADRVGKGTGEPGDFYPAGGKQTVEELKTAAAEYFFGQLPVPVPVRAPGRAPAFPLRPDDRQEPDPAGGYAVPRGKPARKAPAPAIPWEAFALPHGRPGSEAVAGPIDFAGAVAPLTAPSGPPGAPFQMLADDARAPIVASSAPLLQTVDAFVTDLGAAGDAAERFRALFAVGPTEWPSRHASEMDDDELLRALSGEPYDEPAPPPRRASPPGDATLGSGGAFRAAADVDAIGDAADEAAGKLAQLPAALRSDEMASAGREGAGAFTGAFLGELRSGLAEAEALVSGSAARMSASASFTARPVIAPRIVPQRGPAPVDADRGANMPNISERTP